MAGSAHHPMADRKRVHDVEREQGNMRCLEHVATSVEHEIRRFIRGRYRRWALAQPHERCAAKLQARQRGDVAAGLAELDHAVVAAIGEIKILSPHSAPRHRQKEARIDAIVAGLDAGPAQHAGCCPPAGRVRPIAGSQELDDAGHDGLRRFLGDIRRCHTWASLHTFAASGAGIEHVSGAAVQRRLEAELVHRPHSLG